MIERFVTALRANQVWVGLEETLTLARALKAGLHENSLHGFYHLARCVLVHREEDLDRFDEVFASYFRGAPSFPPISEALLSWLENPLASGEALALPEVHELRALRERFWERVQHQKERHDGGRRHIGTGGTSPFGQGGAHPQGIRVGGVGGGRSAVAVADPRRYRPYRSDLVLDVRQIEVSLRKLRALAREGSDLELDVETTIHETGKQGGELEVVLRPKRRSTMRVLLLLDVGGSMDPHVEVVSQLFSAAKRASHFRELRTYYFHNCIYGRLFETERFTDPTPIREVLRKSTEKTRLVVIGDAAMHPAELYGEGDLVV